MIRTLLVALLLLALAPPARAMSIQAYDCEEGAFSQKHLTATALELVMTAPSMLPVLLTAGRQALGVVRSSLALDFNGVADAVIAVSQQLSVVPTEKVLNVFFAHPVCREVRL